MHPADNGPTVSSADPAIPEAFPPGEVRGLRNRVLRLGGPMVVEAAMHNVFNLVELLWISRLGAAAIAGVGLAHVALIAVMGLAFGWGAAGAASVARRIGAGDPEGASEVATAVIVWGVGAGTLLGLLVAAVAGPVLAAAGVPAGVAAAAEPYLWYALGGIGLVAGAGVSTFMLRAAGDARQAMTAFMAGTALSLLLQPALIIGWGGLPALGMAGAGVALVAGRGATLAGVLVLMARGGATVRFAAAGLVRWSALRPLVPIALAGSGQAVLRNISPLTLYALATPLGTAVLAAVNIVIKVQLLAQIIAQGLANAANTLVGQALGARRPDLAAAYVKVATGYGVGALAAAGLLVLLAAESIVTLFAAEAEVVAQAAAGARIVAVAFPAITAATVLAGALNGAGETRMPAAVNLVTLGFLQAGTGVVLVRVLPWGAVGIWIALLVAWTANAALAAIVFRRGAWRRVRL